VKELRRAALDALVLRDPGDKQKSVAQAAMAGLPVDSGAILVEPRGGAVPGRPERPRLVAPTAVAQRGVGTEQGRAALLHALAHIEFNAINLALDAVWRFSELPEQYYRDWIEVAVEEARHFALLSTRMAALGCRYGEFDAHDGLWEMAHKTRHDPLLRMALVPRVLEARGLDACPQVRDKLLRVGDSESAAIIDVLLREEIGHVAIGNRWFHHLCARAGRDPAQVEAQARIEHGAPALRPPFNLEARRAAGFNAEELATLNAGRSPDRL